MDHTHECRDCGAEIPCYIDGDCKWPGGSEGCDCTAATTIRPLTIESVTESIRKAVETKGADYVYRGDCLYFAQDEKGAHTVPDCIVGHVLADHGYTLETLNDACIIVDPNVNGRRVRDLGMSLGIVPDLADALQCAQNRQDNRSTWGVAESAFLRTLDQREV